jgi:uncharacterized protein (DUF1330 family)
LRNLKITDRTAYDRYQAKFMGVMKHFHGRVLAADEKPQVIEGEWDRDKVVLLSFPDEKAFRDWAEYRNIWKLQRTGKQEQRLWCCW